MWMVVITVSAGLVLVSLVAVLAACRPRHHHTPDTDTEEQRSAAAFVTQIPTLPPQVCGRGPGGGGGGEPRGQGGAAARPQQGGQEAVQAHRVQSLEHSHCRYQY